MLGDHFVTEWFITCVFSTVSVLKTVMYNFLADRKTQQFLHKLQPVKELSRLHHLQNLVHVTHQPCPSNGSTGSQFALNLCSWLSKLPLSVLPPKSQRSRNILPLLYILVFHNSSSSLNTLGYPPEDATCPAFWLCSTLPQDLYSKHLSIHVFAALPIKWPKVLMQVILLSHCN